MESQKSLDVTTAGNHNFVYTLNPLLLKQEGCKMDSVCYDCLYDLEIIITDDCNNNKLGGKAFDTVVRNFSLNGIDTICNNGTGFTVAFTKWLPEGSYEITKRLSVSKYAMDYYRDSVFMAKNTCRSLDDFIAEQRALRAQLAIDCKPSCATCEAEVGDYTAYRTRFMTNNGIAMVDAAAYESMARQSFEEARQRCLELCDKESDTLTIRKSMLMDMMPSSGQYANIDRLDDRYSIFFSRVDSTSDNRTKDTLAAYTLVTNYRNADGQPELVYDEAIGQLVPPQKLTAEQFAQRFQPSWAEALLPRHPEYAKLDRYTHLEASHAWDRKFEAIDTYAEARAAGYLNPIDESTVRPYFGTNSNNIDPLYSLKNNFFMTFLRDSLLQFRKVKLGDGKGTPEVTLSLWSAATITVMCPGKSNNQTCVLNYSTNAKAFNADSMCAAEQDMAWRSFRQLYLEVKRRLVNKYVKGCEGQGCMTAAAIVATGHQPHFTDAAELLQSGALPPLPSDTNEAKAMAQKYYEDNCKSYVTHWLEALAPCAKYDTGSLNQVIIPALIDICKAGSDLQHPYGSSSVSAASTRPGHLRSFEAYLQYYNANNGVTDKVNCNAYGIAIPKPYDQQVINGNKPLYNKPDTCECNNISRLYTKFKPKRTQFGTFSNYLKRVYQTDIADSTLNTLLALCGNIDFPATTCHYVSQAIYLPPVFQCNANDVCVDCNLFKQLNTAFKDSFPEYNPGYLIPW